MPKPTDPKPTKLLTTPPRLFDPELAVMQVCLVELSRLNWHQRKRVFDYLLLRLQTPASG
jgi:hypothetical protein